MSRLEKIAAHPLGRPVLFGVLGLMTVQAVATVRRVVDLADVLTGRSDAPCTDCADKRAAVVDAAAPADPAAGDSSSPFAGDDLEAADG